MKAILRHAIAATVKRLPWGAQRAALDALASEVGAATALSRLAREVGIVALMADGNCGLIEGPVDDALVLPTYARKGQWAPGTIKLLQEFFALAGGVYIDVGANIGLTTIPIARNPNVEVHAFEPDPVVFARLSANVARGTGANAVLADANARLAAEGYDYGLATGNGVRYSMQDHFGP